MRLNNNQLRSLADISGDIAQVILAALVVEPIVAKRIDWIFFVVGLLLSFAFWSANLFLVRRMRV